MDELSDDLMLALSLHNAHSFNQNIMEMAEDGIFLGQQLDDRDVAISIFRDELRSEATALADQRLARAIAENDEEDEQPKSPFPSVTPIFDSIEERMARDQEFRADEELTLSNLETLHAESLAYQVTPSKRVAWGECVVCQDFVVSDELLRAECSDHYCKTCINELFVHATNDESLFPPRCCRQEIRMSSAKPLLSPEILENFERKAVEYKTKNRTYCYDTTCGLFISQENIEGEKATCRICGKSTCTICKSSAHENDCPKDPAYERLMQTAKENGYQKCFNCNRLVELNIGCNHMTCLCRSEFCYNCGVKWKNCDCDIWDEDRLLIRAEVNVDRGLPALDELDLAMEIPVRAARILQEVDRIRVRIECQHTNWQKLRGVNLRCEECSSVLPTYLLECRICRLRACVRCKRNRL